SPHGAVVIFFNLQNKNHIEQRFVMSRYIEGRRILRRIIAGCRITSDRSAGRWLIKNVFDHCRPNQTIYPGSKFLVQSYLMALLTLVSTGTTYHSPDHHRNMVLIAGAVVQIGIEESEIPRLKAVFNAQHREVFDAEIPKHAVRLTSFYIDKYLVTN